VIFLFKYRELKIRKNLLVFLFYIVLLWPFSPNLSAGAIIIINIASSIILGNFFYKKSLTIFNFEPLILGTIICSILLLPDIVKLLPLSVGYVRLNRIPQIEGSDILVGPNGWAQMLGVATVLLLVEMYEVKRVKVRYVVMLLTLCFLIYLTGSRTIFYAILGMLVFFLISVFSTRNISVLNKLLIVLVFVVGANMVFNIELGSSRVFNIYSDNAAELGGRREIWDIALDVFTNKMNVLQELFGVGTGGAGVYIARAVASPDDHISPHSFYLDTLINFGIVGFIIHIGFWIHSLYIMWLKKRSSIYYFIPFFVLFIGITNHFFINIQYCIMLSVTNVILLEISTSVNNKKYSLYERKIHGT